MLQAPVRVVKAEEQRTDGALAAVLMPAETSDDAVAIPLVLYLEHHAFARLVGAGGLLRHDPVEARAFEAPEPILGRFDAGGRRRQVERGFGASQDGFQTLASLTEWQLPQILVAFGQDVEEYE